LGNARGIGKICIATAVHLLAECAHEQPPVSGEFGIYFQGNLIFLNSNFGRKQATQTGQNAPQWLRNRQYAAAKVQKRREEFPISVVKVAHPAF
jgi:hypothetical protein